MSAEAQDAIRVVLLDADEQFRTLMTHHITAAWPGAEVAGLAHLGELDESAQPDCFVLDHMTLQQAANATDASLWFRAAAAIASSPCIVVADPSDELLAVRYMKGGARDYLPKRLIKHDVIVASISDCLGAGPAGDSRGGDAPSPPARTDAPRPCADTTVAAPAADIAPCPPPGSGGADGGDAPAIAGYRIIRALAKGGVARVCLAHSDALDCEVALKVLRVSKSTAANKLYERFEQEYRLISTIDSPSVVKTYDFGRTSSEVYIAFEYFRAGDLRARMNEGVAVEAAMEYLRKIAVALNELHGLGILHRDLKPANVMLREDDSIALIDFGMAKQLQSTENLTLPGTIQGTPHYLSPEQAKGKAVDARSDIYSLGVMFYELLEGTKPYTGETALNVCMSHISDPVPQLSARHAGYQPILDWMMAKDLDQRCPRVQELLDVLGSKGANTSPG